MSARWIRVPSEPRHDLTAALVAGTLAVGVGVATFYMVRLLLAREPLPGGGPEREATPPHEQAGGGA